MLRIRPSQSPCKNTLQYLLSICPSMSKKNEPQIELKLECKEIHVEVGVRKNVSRGNAQNELTC